MSHADRNGGNIDPYAPFRLTDFRKLISTWFLIGLSVKMQVVILGWDIYERTGSTLAIGWIGLAQFVPSLLLFLPAGQLADRHDRRKLLSLGFAISAAAAILLAALALLDAPTSWFYVACFIGAIGQVINRPARAAMLASVVPAPLLSGAVAWAAGAFQIATFAGPVAAGVILAANGNAIAGYGLIAALNILAMVLALRIQRRDHAAGAGKSGGLHHLLGGLTHIRKTRVILGVCLLDMLMVVFSGAMGLLPVYAKDILKVGPSGLGWLAAAPAIGAIIMLLAINHLPASRRPGLQLLWAIAGYGICTVLFGLSEHFALSLAALAAMGALNSIGVVTRQTVIQSNTPDQLRGRVSSSTAMFTSASPELAQLEAGLMSTLTSPVITVVCGGIATLGFVALVNSRFPSVRQLKPLALHQA